MKFGGSSVADADEMMAVMSIISNVVGQKVVVLSACKGITDKLEQLAIISADKNQNNNNQKENILNYIKTHHINILNSTLKNYIMVATNEIQSLLNDLENILQGISFLKELTSATKDAVLAFGELLSTAIFHFICKEHQLNSAFLDARNLIYTNDNYNDATPFLEQCSQNIKKEFGKIESDLIITQGFIGSYNDGIIRRTTTLGRGGSDYSAAIIGSMVDAEDIQIWTDVNGILSADPRYYNDVQTIKQMSFEEIKDLSFWGAKVLHPKTIMPAIEKNINIKVLNTFNPANEGTLITANNENNLFKVNSVIAKENCFLNISSKKSLCFSAENVLYSGYCNEKYITLLNKNNLPIGNEHSAIKDFIDCSVVCIGGANFNFHLHQLFNFLSSIKSLENVAVLQIIFEFSFSSILLVIGSDCDVHKIVKEISKKIIFN